MRRLLLPFLLFLVASVAYAAVTATPVFVQFPKLYSIQITAKDTATTLFTCGASGSKIIGIWATNTDTATHNVLIYNTNATSCAASSSIVFGGLTTAGCAFTVVAVPASSGFAAGTAPVNLMSAANWPGLPTESDGNPFWLCTGTSDVIKADMDTTIGTASRVVNVNVLVSDF